MKPEINAATEFLSRIFLAHNNITQEKVGEFRQHLATLLEERFRDHWHEGCPTKGQAYRCIRVCPDEPLDPLLEKVCNDVGVNVEDFNLPFELTLWVDPTEVVCKFGDLKCSYHTVAKKDHSSGNLNNQTENLDIDDLVENARDLYLKKQTVVIHPIHSSEMHISSPYSDGSSNGFTMAVRMNGTMHYNMSGSPPPSYDGSPRGKGKSTHSNHKRGGYHYYGKSSGGKGTYIVNGVGNGGSTHATSTHHSFSHHRNHHHHNQHHQHNQHGSSGQQNLSSAYSNGYLNGYSDENGYGFDQHSISLTKMNGVNGLPPLTTTIGPGQVTRTSPTPEQIQQQMQHPPPIPPPSMPHLTQAFSHSPTDSTTMLPPPPLPSQLPPPPSTMTTVTTTSNSSHMNNSSGSNSSHMNNSSGSVSGKPMSNSNTSKYPSGMRGHAGPRNKQASPVREVK